MTTNNLELRQSLAAELSAAIARTGLSRAEVARRAGMQEATLARKLAGESRLYMHELEALASAGIDMGEVVDGALRLAGR